MSGVAGRCSLLLSLLLAGLPTVVAAAIEPGAAAVAVCVVAPRVEGVDGIDALGIVPLPSPRLVVVEPLLELRIQRQGRPIWQQRGSPEQPIRTPIDWPSSPIQPDELVLLQLRPLEASGDSFAHVHLAGASRQRMEASDQLVRSLGRRPEAWLGAFEAALDSGDVPLAWALLFNPQAPEAAELTALREEVIRRGCQD
ncbi:MAG: hypothetical protein VKI63_07295 [Cyanobium sp.]|nr:hypothetical protein [Cyanobium sp.]